MEYKFRRKNGEEERKSSSKEMVDCEERNVEENKIEIIKGNQ